MKKPHCSKCGRGLTDPFSIAVGMGPICRGQLSQRGWRFPKPKWRVRGGHVELVGMSGKVAPPSTEPAKDEKQELVRRVLRNGGPRAREDAIEALYDYMREKDSRMPKTWCARFVQGVIDQMNMEAAHG